MENNKVVDNKKKKLLPIIAVIAVVIIIAVIAILTNKKPAPTQNTGEQTPATTETANTESPVAATGTASVNPVLEGATVQAPGADLISKTGQVVNQEGKAIKTNVDYNSPEAPKQTMPVAVKEIPFATKLTLDANGFNPKEFKINKGKALTVALTGSGDSSHVFTFEDPSLRAVYINIRPGETRAVTFNAPMVAGEYVFFCDFPGHRNNGEVGKMIVQ